MTLARRYLRIFAGFTMLALGFIMALPLVPGPGVLVMVGGLMLLAEDFPWAQRVLDWGKEKLDGGKEKWRRWRR